MESQSQAGSSSTDPAMGNNRDQNNTTTHSPARYESHAKYYKVRVDLARDTNLKVPLPEALIVWLDAYLPSPGSVPPGSVYLVGYEGKGAPLQTQLVYANVLQANIKVMEVLEEYIHKKHGHKSKQIWVGNIDHWEETRNSDKVVPAQIGDFSFGGERFQYLVNPCDGTLQMGRCDDSWTIWVERKNMQS